MFPGEYPQPALRLTTVQVPMVSGYATARLRWQGSPVSGYGNRVEHTTQVLVENTGLNPFTVQLQETDDRSVSGARTNLGAATALVASGRHQFSVTPSQAYLEAWCTADGPGELKLQLASQLRWDILGFSDDDPFYPTLQLVAEVGAVLP